MVIVRDRSLPARTLVVCVAALFWAAVFGAEAQPAQPAAEKAPLLERVLELNRIQEPELDLDVARKEFKELVAQAKTALADAQTPRDKVAALSKALLANREVSYLSNIYWRDSTLAASLLRRKGNCLSTSTLFVLAGEELGLPIRMVLVPHHVFVRWDDGQTYINVETTKQGAEIPDRAYMAEQQIAPQDAAALRWGRSLDKDGFLAEIMEAAGRHRWRENRLEDAMGLLSQVEKLVPYRSDLRLEHLILQAETTGKRAKVGLQVVAFMMSKGLPPSVWTSAMLWVASEAAADKMYEKEREILLAAFRFTPKSYEYELLSRLAFCHRSLKDYRGAVRYMELAAALVAPESPERADTLYSLAILQKNDGRLDEALESIRAGLKINSESWNLQMLEAGYMVLRGEREEGLKRFGKIERPRGDEQFYEDMLAWSYAITRQRDKFYAQFEHALSIAHSPHTLIWIEQDVDLDVYRNEPEFEALVEKHRQRILGEPKATQKPGPAEKGSAPGQ